jgi:hypothetical protein
MGYYEKGLSLALYTEINPALIKHKDGEVHRNKQLNIIKITFTISTIKEMCLQNP